MSDKTDYAALQRLCFAAEEERRAMLAAVFAEGPDSVRHHAIHEIALAVAAMDLCRNHYTQADLEAAAQTRMHNDPVFHATVARLYAILDEYMDTAVTARRR